MSTEDPKNATLEPDDGAASAASATKTTKRKSTVEEIEVDLSAPEPPSKRAKRALKKGKTLTKKTSADKKHNDDLMEDEDDKATAKDKHARSEHGVWIGNLPFTVTSVELRDWLVSNSGESITPESITRVKLPTLKDPGRDKSTKPANRGFAYVDFSDLNGKVAAIALSETDLGGRKLLIKDSTSFEGRPKKETEDTAAGANGDSTTKGDQLQDQRQAFKRETEPSRKIFVGNMSFQTTEEDVRRNFDKCGEIEFVKVATFEDSGKCKGFGWVKFKEPEAAAWAVKGFVKIKEEVETEEDFNDDADEAAADRVKHYKTRKWWVNRIFGRTLKIELAEDDASRYKKRFGKDAQKTDGKDRPPPRGNTRRDPPAPRKEGGSSGGGQLKESSDINVARLTGAVVKSTGTKVTFD